MIPVPKESPSADVGDCRLISITPFPSKVFEKIVAEKLSHFLDSDSLLLLSRFSYCNTMMLCSHCLTIYKLL